MVGASKHDYWPNKVWVWVKGHGSKVFTALAGVLSAICGFYGEDLLGEGLWAFIALLISLVLALLLQFPRPSYADLDKELEQVKERSQRRGEAVERALSMLLRRLAIYCDVNEMTDRISVYYRTADHFVMVARHSHNPEYAEPGRRRYPLDQGVVGNAWREGRETFRAVSLPATAEAWVKAMTTRKHGFTEEEARGIKMKSREIGTVRISNPESAVGMLVIESTSQDRFEQFTLDKAWESHIFSAISEFVSVYAPVIPRAERISSEPTPPPDDDLWRSTKPPSHAEPTDKVG